jgi:predicted AlkP superfamily pyrophosphatase or phosphodiesterase
MRRRGAGRPRRRFSEGLERLRVRGALAIATGLVAALSMATPGPAQQQNRPKLIVLLVVDQMRADYLERYSGEFSVGLRRLMREGAWFTRAAYPYLNTVTCAGHSTIGTGTFPYRHGMVLNAWLDRRTGTSPGCTEDETVAGIGYNALPAPAGHSAKRLLVPAIGEWVRTKSAGRAVALSLKPRSAIPMVGHSGDVVVWFDDRGGWATSSAFAKMPAPRLQQFFEKRPIALDHQKIWTRTLDASTYQYEDDAPAERPANGMTRTFPHALSVPGSRPDGTFYARWQRSPFSDEYLGEMAITSIDALKLGRGKGTDFFAVSFSALDLVGHVFGPRSQEVQDLLVRLDRTIGRLLDRLDREVGAGNYVLALSADHGVAEVPEQVQRGGRVPSSQIRETVQRVLVPLLGAGDYVESTAYTDIYLTDAALRRLREDDRLMTAVLDALRKVPGVARAFRGDELASESARKSADLVRRAAALSYHPGRSGDLVIVPSEDWLLSSNVTTHGTHYPYDQRVPVILFGASVRAGQYPQEATPADIAPTLTAIAGIPMERPDGRVLSEALVSSLSSRPKR